MHLIGVAGTGMGSFAGMLKAAGYEVTGSRRERLPAHERRSSSAGASRPCSGYGAENLDRARPDLVIVGNVIRRVNPEATAMRERGLPHMLFPAGAGRALHRPAPRRRGGGHPRQDHHQRDDGPPARTTPGATPPSWWAASPATSTRNFRLGRGPHFVVEGDEYDTAYFDKGPKFLHYRPRTAIFTSVRARPRRHLPGPGPLRVRLRALRARCCRPTASWPPARRYPSASWRIAAQARCRVETYAVERRGRLGGRGASRSARTGPASTAGAPAARPRPGAAAGGRRRTTSRTRSGWRRRPARWGSRSAEIAAGLASLPRRQAAPGGARARPAASR